MFSQARPTSYLGKLKSEDMIEWIKKKTSIPSNRIKSHIDLIKKVSGVDGLVVFVGPLHLKHYRIFLQVAKDLLSEDDIEFAHIDINDYDKE